MAGKYYFLTDFVDREQFMCLKNNFIKHRENIGRIADKWSPGELEKYALDCGLITIDQYKQITKSTLM